MSNESGWKKQIKDTSANVNTILGQIEEGCIVKCTIELLNCLLALGLMGDESHNRIIEEIGDYDEGNLLMIWSDAQDPNAYNDEDKNQEQIEKAACAVCMIQLSILMLHDAFHDSTCNIIECEFCCSGPMEPIHEATCVENIDGEDMYACDECCDHDDGCTKL